jgi:esterase/lipase superfamily enzyme
MLFITNRVLRQSHRSRAGRNVSFDYADNTALPSLFFCRRNGQDDYTEVLSVPFFEELRQSPAEQILLFLHGFNSLPEDAIFQRATKLQERFDEKKQNLVQVVPLVWPCLRGESIVQRYYTDRDAADQSNVAFGRALAKFAAWRDGGDSETFCAKRINVLAHSMGARVLREALAWWCREILRFEPPQLFRNVFLPAADLINETLEPGRDGHLITIAARNVAVYFAYDDLALRASKVANAIQVSRRLGHTGPYDMSEVPAQVFAKDCSDFNNTYDPPLGHSYFLDDDEGQPGKVFEDMAAAVRVGRVPDSDQPTRSFVL